MRGQWTGFSNNLWVRSLWWETLLIGASVPDERGLIAITIHSFIPVPLLSELPIALISKRPQCVLLCSACRDIHRRCSHLEKKPQRMNITKMTTSTTMNDLWYQQWTFYDTNLPIPLIWIVNDFFLFFCLIRRALFSTNNLYHFLSLFFSSRCDKCLSKTSKPNRVQMQTPK